MAKLEHPPAFQFYPADFASDGLVEAMTSEEVGAYILLLCKAWYESPVGSIPDDDRVLARWARLSPDVWQVCKANVLAPFTLRTDGRWHQKRLRHCYDETQRRKNERSEAGKRAAASRWHANGSHADAMRTHSDGNANAMRNDASSSSSSSSSPNDSPSENLSKRHFRKPTVDEVRAYCMERKNSIDPERFVDHYEANGWKIGKSPMKDWKAAVRTWERNDGRTGTNVRGNGSLHGSPARPDASGLLAQLAAEEAKAAGNAGSGPREDARDSP